MVRATEPYFLAKIIHVKSMGSLVVYRQLFVQFIGENLGIDKRILTQLFDHVEKPNNGSISWLVKSHRRFNESLTLSFVSFMRKLKYTNLDGHGCFANLKEFSSMGRNGYFVRKLKGTVGQVVSFLGLTKAPLGTDQR